MAKSMKGGAYVIWSIGGLLIIAVIVVIVLWATGVFNKKNGANGASGPSMLGPGGIQKHILGPGGVEQAMAPIIQGVSGSVSDMVNRTAHGVYKVDTSPYVQAEGVEYGYQFTRYINDIASGGENGYITQDNGKFTIETDFTLSATTPAPQKYQMVNIRIEVVTFAKPRFGTAVWGEPKSFQYSVNFLS
jgi:hypothetical protein